jgi:hypothetical protein
MLELAKASPEAVGRHDREAWIGLFSRHGIIEDPVGSKPHHAGVHDPRSGVRGPGPLERFFDTFINPNEITFGVEQDIVSGRFVVRDVTITIDMGGLQVSVPMHVVYEMTEEHGALKVLHLRAHWELLPMIAQVIRKGLPGMLMMNRLGLRMIGNQGIGGILGFCRGLRGIHGGGKRTVNRFVEAVNHKDPSGLAGLFARENKGIEFPAGQEVFTPQEFCKQVEPSLFVTKLICAGYVTSCTFTAERGEKEWRGVGFFEFDSRNRKLYSVQLVCE